MEILFSWTAMISAIPVALVTCVITAFITVYVEQLKLAVEVEKLEKLQALDRQKFEQTQELEARKLREQLKSEASKLERQYQLEFAAERAARALLDMNKWQMRSLYMIRKRLGGFTDDELRQILVRAGAVRFHSTKKKEFWGLIERNRDVLDEEELEIQIGNEEDE